jgi:hypothetical protein
MFGQIRQLFNVAALAAAIAAASQAATMQTLLNFYPDGYPEGYEMISPLVQGPDGNLWGTTTEGGYWDQGGLFYTSLIGFTN